MSAVNRLFIRNYGAVIPDTAIGTVMFNTWTEVTYELDRSVRIINPIVHTIETVYVSATISLVDENIAKILIPEEASEDDEDDEDEEEEEEVKPKKRRGRPSKKEEVAEEVVEPFEPVELEIVFFNKRFTTASEPLNVSTPMHEAAEISEKNSRVINKNINHYSALFTQLEQIYENLSQDVEGANNDLAAVVDDMIPGSGPRMEGIQQSAVDEYRAKQRRQENRIINEIDESLTKFQNIISRRSFTTEALPLTGDILVGETTTSAISIVNTFFAEELVSME